MKPPRHFEQVLHLGKRHKPGTWCANRSGEQASSLPLGRVPRVARLLALALRFEELLQAGTVRHYADLARLGQVSRTRISQIMNLCCLAPDIQEEILLLPLTQHGRDPVTLAQLQSVAAILDWPSQRRLWQQLLQAKGLTSNRAADQQGAQP
jgi:hypothetical protein